MHCGLRQLISAVDSMEIPTGPGPMGVLREAIKAVPALRYGLASVGIVAAVVVALKLASDVKVAMFGVMAAIVIMVVVVVFARLASPHTKNRHATEFVLLWYALIMFMTITTLSVSSFFIGWPTDMRPGSIELNIAVCLGDGYCPEPTAIRYSCGQDLKSLPVPFSGCEGYERRYGVSYVPAFMWTMSFGGGTCGTSLYQLQCLRSDLASAVTSNVPVEGIPHAEDAHSNGSISAPVAKSSNSK